MQPDIYIAIVNRFSHKIAPFAINQISKNVKKNRVGIELPSTWTQNIK